MADSPLATISSVCLLKYHFKRLVLTRVGKGLCLWETFQARPGGLLYVELGEHPVQQTFGEDQVAAPEGVPPCGGRMLYFFRIFGIRHHHPVIVLPATTGLLNLTSL